jgi:hypothetical protein
MRWTKKAVERARAKGRRLGHGGWRPGAGRPRGRTKVAHLAREPFDPRRPVKVTLKVAKGVPSLKRPGAVKIINTAVAAASERDDFRVRRHAVERDRLVLTVLAGGLDALARGMQSISVRVARRVNTLYEREGTFFAERYEYTQATSQANKVTRARTSAPRRSPRRQSGRRR